MLRFYKNSFMKLLSNADGNSEDAGVYFAILFRLHFLVHTMLMRLIFTAFSRARFLFFNEM